jgi:tRNA(Ile)-lysidine synthase
MDLPDRVRRSIQSHGTLRRGQRVIVAVSGGVDSMVLLHLLNGLREEFEWTLSVAHFNHQLRGRASAADERWVRREAERLGLDCDVGRGNVRRHAIARSVSIEMAARELRHEFFAACARRRRAACVALAHHADDQAELFLMRLMRGAGGAGLGGMRAHGVSPANPRVGLVRPLLDVSKVDLLEFAGARRIRFRADASNQSVDFDRNWVRLKLLPLLRKRQPAIGGSLSRSIVIAQADSDFARDTALSWLKQDRSPSGAARSSFEALPAAVQRQVIQERLRRLGQEPEFQLIEWLRLRPGSRISVHPQLTLMRDQEGNIRPTPLQSAHFTRDRKVVDLAGAARGPAARWSRVVFGGITLAWRVLRRGSRPRTSRTAGHEMFDADRVGARLLLRHWQPGDRFHPIGLPSAVKLQDWFTNRKLPAAWRRALVLAATEAGEVFWVEGERIGERAKIVPGTRRVLELRWTRA